METYHGTDLTQFKAFPKLQAFIEKSRSAPGSFEEFERALGEQMRALENELKAEQLARYDIDAQTIVVGGASSQGPRPGVRGRKSLPSSVRLRPEGTMHRPLRRLRWDSCHSSRGRCPYRCRIPARSYIDPAMDHTASWRATNPLDSPVQE